MKKIFIGQSVTGEDRKKIEMESQKIKEVLENKGYEAVHIINYPPEIAKQNRRYRLGQYAFKKIDKCEKYLAIIRTENKSEGMLIEIGHILDKDKEIILAIQKNVNNTYLPDIADKVIRFSDFNDLLNELEKIVL